MTPQKCDDTELVNSLTSSQFLTSAKLDTTCRRVQSRQSRVHITNSIYSSRCASRVGPKSTRMHTRGQTARLLCGVSLSHANSLDVLVQPTLSASLVHQHHYIMQLLGPHHTAASAVSCCTSRDWHSFIHSHVNHTRSRRDWVSLQHLLV